MTTTIIITICTLLLLAYVFDISSALTKIPSVILLLLLGWTVKQAVEMFSIRIPDLNPLLPILGTIGLILIVLEGSLELELNKSKLPLIKKSLLNALIPMFALAFLFAFAFQYFSQISFKMALVNAIPFCVISSAIAIPSARNLSNFNKEFITYESSLSDIFGVLLFNFIALNQIINAHSFGNFAKQLLLIIVISFVAVLGLSFLLSRIKHHITFTPIILIVILIYAVSKVYHLPGLIFILVFGLFLGNLDELKRFNWIEKLRPEKLDKEVKKFKEITTEATFLTRALFFLLFGFLMQAKEILNPATIPWAAGIVLSIILVRWIALKFSKLPSSPLLFVAPRGLITILLFLSILPEQGISIVNKSFVIQTIILSILVMMLGLMTAKKNETK
ncbi:MAG: sodium:proton antiporter [Flavobacteriales bacterium]|nr:sodium:proton antiporter [Flavobacteriales bacterium]MDP4717492.1 sodium:proton antiporter [Flavobacteriales bacterium]MDP4730847.1 sodium:proton antiporter [Flavobacteriales bacterium]MDP4817815.1 sodium:proton antiporter [Flavobacteriales bacterium]